MQVLMSPLGRRAGVKIRVGFRWLLAGWLPRCGWCRGADSAVYWRRRERGGKDRGGCPLTPVSLWDVSPYASLALGP